jgi:pimeloyl-ACP methyl ester carboxylesterase
MAAVLGAGLVAAGCAATGPQPRLGDKPGQVVTGDGVTLHYVEAGQGKPLVMIPGWSQTAAMFKLQIEELSRRYRVIAVDMRGHGESDKPGHGYRIARLAADIHDVLVALNLQDVTLAGHSMGCSIIWSYWDHFGSDRLARLILIDQAPAVTVWPQWTDEQRAEAGALFDPKSLYDTAAALAGPDGARATENFVYGIFFSRDYPKDRLAWILEENLKLPRPHAANLLVDHCAQDWRDVIPRINVHTLIFGGKASFFTPASQEWIHKQIAGSRLEIFEADEGGSHFMFMENPAKFNRIVTEFMG